MATPAVCGRGREREGERKEGREGEREREREGEEKRRVENREKKRRQKLRDRETVKYNFNKATECKYSNTIKGDTSDFKQFII